MSEFNGEAFKEAIDKAAAKFTEDVEAVDGVKVYEVTYQIAYEVNGNEQVGVASGSTHEVPEALRIMMLNEALNHRA